MRKLVLSLFTLLLLQQAFSQAGQLDPSYGNGGTSAVPNGDVDFRDMAIQPNGKIVATGVVSLPDNGGTFKSIIVRYTMDGQLDKTFSGDGILNDPFFKPDDMYTSVLAVQKDGKLLAAGPTFGMARYNPDGTPDKSFGTGGYVTTDPVPGYQAGISSIVVTKDGKILVAGGVYGEANADPKACLVTYLPNGTVESIQVFYSGFGIIALPALAAYKSGGYAILGRGDNDAPFLYSSKFGQATVPLKNAYYQLGPANIAILENEKIAFTIYHRDDNTDEVGTYLAVVNTDGTLDKSFSGDGVLENGGSSGLAAQKDGKIIVGGGSQTIYRYNSNGSLDLTMTLPQNLESTPDIIAYGNRIYVLTRNRVVAFQLDNNPRTMKVNLFGGVNPYNNGEWNNWNTTVTSKTGLLNYSDSTASSITASLSKRDGVSDNSAGYGSGMAPAEVLRYASFATSTRTLTLSGLSSYRKYSVELYASRGAFNSDTTVFAVNGVLKKIGTYRNVNDKAVFTNLSPNAQGQIIITLSSTGTNNYLNGFTLTENYVATTTAMAAAAAPRVAETTADLSVNVSPNPSRQGFMVQLKSSDNKPMVVRVIDAAGRVVETAQNIAANTSLSLGQAYKPGVYYIETTQAGQRRLTKVVKE